MLGKTFALRAHGVVLGLAGLLLSGASAQNISKMTMLSNYLRPGSTKGTAGSWGWTADNGKEYALITSQAPGGLSVVDISDPKTPKLNAFVAAGHNSLWFETTAYKNFAYVVSQEGNIGLMIVDMAPVQTGQPAKLITNFTTKFRNAHTIYVDTTVTPARLYATYNGVTGVMILSLENPAAPVELGRIVGETHDMHARGNFLYMNTQYRGTVEIWNVANPAAPTKVSVINLSAKSIELGEMSAGQQTIAHNCWLSDNGKTLYTSEEVLKTSTKAWDISTIATPKYLTKYLASPNIIDHNVYVKGNKLYAAHYTAGLRILDISNPAVMKEVAFHRPSSSTALYGGTWGAYPFFKSGNITWSDMDAGLYVVRDDTEPVHIAGGVARNDQFRITGMDGGSLRFHLPWAGAYALSIYTPAGKEVVNHKGIAGNGQENLMLGEALSGGNYLVKASQGNQILKGSLAVGN